MKMGEIKNYFSKIAKEDAKDDTNKDRVTSILLVVFGVLVMVYFILHQARSTSFFTTAFGVVEMVMLYGPLIFWIVTSAVLLFGLKNLSRNIDSFGGLIFATIGIIWLLVVFPFNFYHFADVLPYFLEFLLRWISNVVAQVFMVLLIIIHILLAIYSGVLRVFVLKEKKKLKQS